MKEKELELAIHAAAKVLRNWIVRHRVRSGSLHPAHQLHKWTPLSPRDGKPGTEKHVVLLNILPVKAAPIKHKPKVRMAGKRKILE